MPLQIEFQREDLTLQEIDNSLKSRGFLIREPIKRMPSGKLGIYIGWAKLPGSLRKLPATKVFPSDWETEFHYHDKLYGVEIAQGHYEYGRDSEITIVMDVQVTEDDERRLCYAVNASGKSLEKLSQAFQHLMTGTLRPEKAWSSAGSVEAPVPDAKEEGSGQHNLPPTAATTADPRAA